MRKYQAGAGVLTKLRGSLRREPLLLKPGAQGRSLSLKTVLDKTQGASPGKGTSNEKRNGHRRGDQQ